MTLSFRNGYARYIVVPPIADAVATADLGVAKNLTLGNNAILQFHRETFNAFNHASFSTPVNSPTVSNFGQITSIGAIPPRIM